MKVSVVKADNYNIETVDKAVNDAVNLIGGWKNFIKKGDKVLIKPNMLTNVTPEKAVTTHPEVVRAVIKAVKNMGALPAVGDSPGISNLKSTAKRTGILTICEEENVPFVYFKQSKAYNYMEGRFIKQFELVDCLSDFDKIISVAKMKTHVFMGVTGAVKNLFGCIVGTDKARFHLRMQKHIDFAHVMVDLYQTIKPTLNIIDGITAMEGQGPMSGDVVDAKIIIASSDGFAADLIMADKTQNVKTRLSFDGEAEYKAACKEINSTLKVLNSEMKLVTAEYKDNASSVDALKAKQAVLQKTYDEQAKKVKETEAALEKCRKATGDNSEESKKLETQLNYQKAALVKTEQELGKTTDEMEKAEKAAAAKAGAGFRMSAGV